MGGQVKTFPKVQDLQCFLWHHKSDKSRLSRGVGTYAHWVASNADVCLPFRVGIGILESDFEEQTSKSGDFEQQVWGVLL